MNADEAYASFWSHIEELRLACLKILAIISIGVVMSFVCYGPIISFLTTPLKNRIPVIHEMLPVERLEHLRVVNHLNAPTNFTLPVDGLLIEPLPLGIEKIAPNTYRLPPGASLTFANAMPMEKSLVVLGPLEGLLSALKLSLWVGGVATSPFWLFVLLKFLSPALRAGEKRLILPFLCTSIVLISIGIGFAFLVTIPLANQYLMAFNHTVGINLWTLSHYLDYTLFLLLANGLAFEICAIGFFAVHLGLVSAEGLASRRRFAIIGALILGALLTPPDILTQIMLAVPLMGLYELVIIYARLKKA